MLFMYREFLSRHGDGSPLNGYMDYARLGTIKLAPAQVSNHDEVLRRSQVKLDHGLAGLDCEDPDVLAALLDRTVPDKKTETEPDEDVETSLAPSF